MIVESFLRQRHAVIAKKWGADIAERTTFLYERIEFGTDIKAPHLFGDHGVRYSCRYAPHI